MTTLTSEHPKAVVRSAQSTQSGMLAACRQLGHEALRAGRYAEAAMLLTQIAAQMPTDAQAQSAAGLACLNGDWPRSATRFLERAAAMAPGHARVASAAGSAYVRLEQAGPAEALLCRALALDPELTDARYNLGVVLLRLNRWAEAETVLRERLPSFGDLRRDAGAYYALLLQAFGFARSNRAPNADLRALMDRAEPPEAEVAAVTRRAERIGRILARKRSQIRDRIVPCLACGADGENRILGPIPVHRAPALFVEDQADLDTLYCSDLTSSRHHWQLVNSSLTAFASSLVIDAVRCAGCGVIYQNYPHTEATVDRYHRVLSRALNADRCGRFGRLHDRGWLKQKLPLARYLWTRCGLAPGSRVLDVGCADAITLWYLGLAGADAHGIEPAEQAVRFAREVLELDHVVCAAYAPDSYAAASFDCIYSHHVLEHTARPLKVLAAVAHHLRPGGHFLLQVPRAVLRPDGSYSGIEHGHLCAFTPEYLARVIGEAGLEVREVDYCNSLDELPPERRDASGKLAIWGDTPTSLSILAVKPR
jgi:SAM-dependent methyltransferase